MTLNNSGNNPLSEVRRYYDRNLTPFLRQSGGVMHRALWAPGVAGRPAALRWIDAELTRRLASLPAGALVGDLGCGVGATARWLCRNTALNLISVTISPRQAQEGQRRTAAAGPLSDRCGRLPQPLGIGGQSQL